MGDLV
jgi:hypothetical protein